MIEKPDPWDLMLQSITAINNQGAAIDVLIEDSDHNQQLYNEIVEQNTLLIRSHRTLNHAIKSINQRLAQLESKLKE